MYGGKRRLEKTLANPSEDDLMNELIYVMFIMKKGSGNISFTSSCLLFDTIV